MKLADLKFDTPNNAAISLTVIAEWVRAGEIKLQAVAEGDTIKIAAFKPVPTGRAVSL